MTKKELLAEIARLKARIAELERTQPIVTSGLTVSANGNPIPYRIVSITGVHVDKYDISYETGHTLP